MAVADNDKNPVGRPEYQPNHTHEEIVRALCLFGANHESIASYIGITAKTLRKYYPELLANCLAEKNGSVEKALYVKAIRGNVDAMIYWLKNRYKEVYNDLPPDLNNDNQAEFLAAIGKALNANKTAE